MRIPVLLLALALAAHCAPIKIDTETNMYVDDRGRERFYHGFNVIYKGIPWAPETTGFDSNTTFSEADYKLWHEWGLNLVRLGTQWPGYEPNKGEFHPEYLDTLETIADGAEKYNITTLLDFHQDLLSEKFCGEGIPLWAAEETQSFYNKFPFPLNWAYETDEQGIPTPESCGTRQWALYQITPSASHGYQALYSNHNGILDAFGNFWNAVAKKFVGKDHVLGYEFINEPWAGDIWTKPWLLINGNADKHNLQPMYEKLAEYVREVDEEHILFFEPFQADSSKGPVGFTQVPGGDAYQNRSTLSFHFYSPPNGNMYDHFKNRRQDMRNLKVGGLLSEFNLNFHVFDVVLVNGTTQEMQATMDICDDYLISWTGWEYKPFFPITGAGYSVFDADGNIKHDVLGTISRPYAQIVAGNTQKMKFDNRTKEFELVFKANQATFDGERTLVYYNKDIHYPGGFVIENHAALVVEHTMKNYFEAYVKPGSEIAIGEELTIRISPNQSIKA